MCVNSKNAKHTHNTWEKQTLHKTTFIPMKQPMKRRWVQENMCVFFLLFSIYTNIV